MTISAIHYLHMIKHIQVIHKLIMALVVLTEIFCSFPESLHENVRIVF